MRYRYLDDFRRAIFRYLPFFLKVLRYWLPPNVPLYETESFIYLAIIYACEIWSLKPIP